MLLIGKCKKYAYLYLNENKYIQNLKADCIVIWEDNFTFRRFF